MLHILLGFELCIADNWLSSLINLQILKKSSPCSPCSLLCIIFNISPGAILFCDLSVIIHRKYVLLPSLPALSTVNAAACLLMLLITKFALLPLSAERSSQQEPRQQQFSGMSWIDNNDGTIQVQNNNGGVATSWTRRRFQPNWITQRNGDITRVILSISASLLLYSCFNELFVVNS